jgi:hypothetical protein
MLSSFESSEMRTRIMRSIVESNATPEIQSLIESVSVLILFE